MRLDFIGPSNPPSLVGNIFILNATYYFLKWSEVVPLKNEIDFQVITFLENYLFSRIVLPLGICIDEEPASISAKLTQLCNKFGAKHYYCPLIIPKEIDWQNQLTNNLLKY